LGIRLGNWLTAEQAQSLWLSNRILEAVVLWKDCRRCTNWLDL